MNYMSFELKNDKKNLPFSFPGQVFYHDFVERRFQTCKSKVFIRPILYIQALIPPEVNDFCLPYREDCCFLLYIKKGQGKIEHNEKSYVLTAGSGLLASAELPLRLKLQEESLSCLFLLITGELLWELYKIQENDILCFTKYQFPDFEQRLNSLLGEYLNLDSPMLFDFSRHMDHLLSRIIHQSIRVRYDTEKEKKQTLMRVITYMKEHCCEQIQVSEIAASFGYSGSHFSRIFQAEFHKSPKKYLIELRIAHAEKLLATSDLSIEIIGQTCAFNTTTHFIQTFKDLHAMTPLQYRKLVKNEKNRT